jgi:hypothetical protein
MATNVYMMKDGEVILGPTAAGLTVTCQITGATIVATPDPKELTTLCGKVTVPGVTGYVLNLDYAQDWTVDTGISMFLYENDGELVEFSVQPTADATPIASGSCYVSPGDFGGTAGEIMVASVSLGCEGKPDITGNAAPVATRAAARERETASAS